MVHRLGCLRGIGTLTGFALAVEIGDWQPVHRQHDRLLRRARAQRVTPQAPRGSRARSPRPATPTCGDCWSRPPGTTAPATGVGKTMRDRWELAPAAARARGDEGNRRLHQRWVRFTERRKKNTIANVAIARELAGWCGPWRSSRNSSLHDLLRRPRGWWQRVERPAKRSMSNEHPSSRRSTLDTRSTLLPKAPSCGIQPAHISLTARRQRHDPGHRETARAASAASAFGGPRLRGLMSAHGIDVVSWLGPFRQMRVPHQRGRGGSTFGSRPN